MKKMPLVVCPHSSEFLFSSAQCAVETDEGVIWKPDPLPPRPALGTKIFENKEVTRGHWNGGARIGQTW
jgi:hypothetical protein